MRTPAEGTGFGEQMVSEASGTNRQRRLVEAAHPYEPASREASFIPLSD
jgi:hypothetical protein